MNLRNVTTAIIVTVSLIGLMVCLVVRRSAQAKLYEADARLKQQTEQLEELAAEHRRLANRATTHESPVEESRAELEKLRAEAEALRKQTNELVRRLAEAPRQPTPKLDARMTRHSPSPDVVSDSDSAEYKEHLYKIGRSSPHSGPSNIDAFKDAQNLAQSLRSYALENGGRFPATFEEAAPYLFKESYYRTPHSSEYEIVYHGTLDELANIPAQVVVVLRERQPWPTPDGKWGRLYATAHGSIKIVESDDNFQAWEAEHIIPPQSAGY